MPGTPVTPAAKKPKAMPKKQLAHFEKRLGVRGIAAAVEPGATGADAAVVHALGQGDEAGGEQG